MPGWVWLFIPPKERLGKGFGWLHDYTALISRIKIPRQLLPKWLRAVQGGWETPGAVTGRRRQTKSSLRHSGSAPGGENQHTHTPRSTSPHCPRRTDTRMPPESPKRANMRWPASLPVLQPHPRGCLGRMSILADPMGMGGTRHGAPGCRGGGHHRLFSPRHLIPAWGESIPAGCVPPGRGAPRPCPPPEPLPAVVMRFATGCHYGKAVRPPSPQPRCVRIPGVYSRYSWFPSSPPFPSPLIHPARKLRQEPPKYSSEGDSAAG